jgi:alpha-galactosidase
MRLIPACVLFLAILQPATHAQAPAHISFDAQTRVFRIDGGESTYAFGVNPEGALETIYWGGRLQPSDPLPPANSAASTLSSFETGNGIAPQEFGGSGAGMLVEPALKITFPDGLRELVLHYVSHTLAADKLTIQLKDITRDVEVILTYKVDSATGILGRSALIENKTKAPFSIEKAAAASLNLPIGESYRLNYLTGRWAGEFNLQQIPLVPGKTILESRRGSTGHQNSPWFAIERSASTDEDHGDVWFGALAWSGSWSISIEQDQVHRVHVVGGFNPFDFGYKLAPGETLETPVLYAGFTKDGLGGASRTMHRFERDRILPRTTVRPVLYNSWEATEFAVDEPGQTKLAEAAASIGVERFVMDDGWFGARKDDHAGLGDWYVNPQKFPHGLKPLIDKVHSLGMDFGLWVEPEMVNPDSDLYRKHPDWILNYPGRPRTEARNQFVLNLARPDVRAYVLGFLDKLVTENDIAFLKWDYNRNWSEPGWPAVAPDEERKVYVEYVHNLYSILRDLRAKHPKLEIESCSGGGGRIDLGIMGLTEEVWTSDNTDPLDRLTIQDGFSYAYTPNIMMAWVTDPGWAGTGRATTLDYRFLVAMQGGLGIGANLNKWTPEDFANVKRLVSDYKLIRETVQHGNLYRLVSPRHDSPNSATETVSQDKSQAVLFAYLHSGHEDYPYPTIRLRGLDPEAQYHLRALEGSKAASAPDSASGRYWMEHGITPLMKGDFKAAAFFLTKITP